MDPIQSLIQERADSFYKLFITDDGDYAYTGNDLNATTAPNFLRESILAGIKLGLELGREQLELVRAQLHNGADGYVDVVKSLTALDEKVAEVEGMMV